MKALLIDNSTEERYRVVDFTSDEDFKRMLGCEEMEAPAIKVGEEDRLFGCACDAGYRDSHEDSDGETDTVVRRVKKLFRKARYYQYVAGPVIVYRNAGLSSDDITYLKKSVYVDSLDGRLTLVANDFVGFFYDETDP